MAKRVITVSYRAVQVIVIVLFIVGAVKMVTRDAVTVITHVLALLSITVVALTVLQ